MALVAHTCSLLVPHSSIFRFSLKSSGGLLRPFRFQPCCSPFPIVKRQSDPTTANLPSLRLIGFAGRLSGRLLGQSTTLNTAALSPPKQQLISSSGGYQIVSNGSCGLWLVGLFRRRLVTGPAVTQWLDPLDFLVSSKRLSDPTSANLPSLR
jgi:hypothetical protein